MNKEIKEILEETRHIIEISDYKNHYHLNEYFEVEHIDKLLDYITNLQQIEQDHKKINGELREENERLKQTQYVWSYDLDIQLEDYKSRCEKAVKYIKTNCSYDEDTNMCCDDLFCGDVDDLLNILQNGSEEK